MINSVANYACNTHRPPCPKPSSWSGAKIDEIFLFPPSLLIKVCNMSK